MPSQLDLDAYFERIGYSGGRSPNLDTLKSIVIRHAEAIPFENLNPLLRMAVRLDIGSLERKMVRGGRGGYCFEQNLLLAEVLRSLGYTTTGLAARVVWNQPDKVETPRGHMLIRVELEGQPYLVDVGFGGLTLTGVLRFEPDVEQSTPHEPFRLLRMGEEFVVQAKIRGEWVSLYRFDLQPQLLRDYEVVNWYLSTHPDSIFLKNLAAARPVAGRRYALRNTDFAIHELNGPTARRTLSTVAEIRAVLETIFGLTLPAGPELDAALDRLCTAVPA